MTIDKLKKLANPESFIQVDLIKGFKYVDRAGELVNKYFNNNTPPQFTMGLNGLVLDRPTDKIQSLKVSAANIWFKFDQTTTMEARYKIAHAHSERIMQILGVERVSRIGWRNYFVLELTDAAYMKALSGLAVASQATALEVKMSLDYDDKPSAIVSIQPAASKDNPRQKALLFDIDVYEEEELPLDEIERKMKRLHDYLKDPTTFLRLVNEVVANG